MFEKKERKFKYHVSTKDNKAPVVLIAESEKAATVKWSKQTGRKETEAVVTQIGARRVTVTVKDVAPEDVKPKTEKEK